MKDKLAQNTKLDKEQEKLLENNIPKAKYKNVHRTYVPQTQGILPFNNFKIYQDIEQSHNDIKKNIKREPLSFDYPDINPENIKYRKLDDKEMGNLVEKDNDNYRRHLNNPYIKDEEFIPIYQNYYNLNKELPEDIKKQIIEKYNNFRTVAALFQQKYKEANNIASQEIELNYDGTYIDLFKNLAKFIIAATKKQLGVLFGIYNESKNHSNNRARALIQFINQGINIFNINPFNFNVKIHELETAANNMSLIIKEYDKRFKVLKKLTQIETDVKQFLLKKEYRDFLKWMDEYFSNDKKEFIEQIVNRILSEVNIDSFTIGGLAEMKTYIDIYSKAKKTVRTDTYFHMERRVKNETETRLDAILDEKVKPKIKEFSKAISDLNLDSLIKYIYKNYRFDIRSILLFVKTSIVNYNKTDTVKEPSNELGEKKYNLFISTFTSNLNDSIAKVINNMDDGGVTKFVRDLIRKYSLKGNLDYKEFSKLTEKDLNDFSNSIMKNVIIDSMPNFDRHENYAFPRFNNITQLIKDTGKFSADGIVDYISKAAPFVPKEFAVHLAKFMIKSGSPLLFKSLYHLSGTMPATAMKIFLNLLNKSGKYTADNFTNLFSPKFDTFGGFPEIYKMVSNFNYRDKLNEKDMIEIFSHILRNTSTIEKDTNNFEEFNFFLHNSTKNLTKQELLKIITNKNYSSYNKVGIVKKLFNAYALVRNMGGLKGIYGKHGELINKMKENGFISKNFDTNIRIIIRAMNSNEEINPASKNFSKLFELTSTMETDLQTIEIGETFTAMFKDYQTKDNRLFKLDLQINDRLRFRVLKDKDPRALRVGIESNCCQRIGGVGEIAARDSFINPLAGVLLLEWRENTGNYILLSQSYFHYVPKTNGYILDNVETNSKNLNSSGVDLSAAYAYLAQHTKEKFDVSYFLSGKGYSKLDTSNFSTYKIRGGDPRYFDNRALTEDNKDFYTDFQPNNSMNLLAPKFDYDKRMPKLLNINQEERKNAFEIHLPRILKVALTAV